MSDKLHKVVGYACAIAMAAITAALAPGGPASGHPQVTMWLQFALGALGLLGVTSVKPLFSGGAPKDAAKILLPFAFVASLSGCAGAGVFGNCIKGQSPQDAQAIVSTIIAIAASPAGYVPALVQLAEQVGPDVVHCVSEALIADGVLTKSQPGLVAHLKEYQAHEQARGMWKACK